MRNAVEADAVYIVATIAPFIGLRGDGNAGFFHPHPGLTGWGGATAGHILWNVLLPPREGDRREVSSVCANLELHPCSGVTTWPGSW